MVIKYIQSVFKYKSTLTSSPTDSDCCDGGTRPLLVRSHALFLEEDATSGVQIHETGAVGWGS